MVCQFFARLLGRVLFHALSAPWRFACGLELSLPKAFRVLQSQGLSRVLAADWPAQLTAGLVCMTNDVLRFAPTHSRHTPPSPCHRLLYLGFTEGRCATDSPGGEIAQRRHKRILTSPQLTERSFEGWFYGNDAFDNQYCLVTGYPMRIEPTLCIILNTSGRG